MHIVKKKGIQSLLRKPEEEEPLGRLWRIMLNSAFERNGIGRLDYFVRHMIRVSGRFFCTS
jgi:hypothetical protein